MPKARISVRAASPSKSEQPRLVARALQLGSQQVPLFSGAVHYFRLKPTAWRPALEALKSCGLNMVETYVPWCVHELRDGSYDFGQYDPQKDLGAFLDMAHSLGLYAFVRPGPNINAELTYFGLPRRVVFDEACQARSARGQPMPFISPPRMFPVPSFASERFYHEVERWYAEAGRVIAPRVWPQGPVVLAQVDNEASFYFRDAPYDQDHHPDALAKYRTFLRSKYGTLLALNHAHAAEHGSWDDAAPPTHCPPDASLPVLRRSLDLMAFQEELLTGALTRLQSALRTAFGPLPTVHNAPMGERGLPTTLSRLDSVVDVNGLDYSHRRSDMRNIKARTLRMVGSVRLPYAPEMSLGSRPWFVTRSDADSVQTLLCACAYGLRGLNLYMLVDRDRWYGAPFDEMGQARPYAEDIRRLMRALIRTQFHALNRRVEVGIMLPKEYARLSRATHTLGAISPALLSLAGAGESAACLNTRFGFETPIQLAWGAFVTQFARALDRQKIPYVFIESDAPAVQLSQLRVLISPTFEFAQPKRIARLASFVDEGGHVICGPHIPRLDDALQAFSFNMPPESPNLQRCTANDAELITEHVIREWVTPSQFAVTPPEVELTVHEDNTGARILFALQPGATAVQAEITLPETMTLIDPLTRERFEGDRVSVPLAGYTCRMFLCEPSNTGRHKSRAPSARRSIIPC